MSRHPLRDRLGVYALRLGVTVPFFYYGIQAVAAPFFPGFSALRTITSDLGSDLSTRPWLFNGGIMLTGFLCLVASAGFQHALTRVGSGPILAWLVALAVALLGAMMIWGGYYPLPDPRHEGYFLFSLGVASLLPLLTASLWRFGGAVRYYFVASLALFVAFMPYVFGVNGLETGEYRGLLQRGFALSVLPPVGVAAYVLARRLGTREAEAPPAP